MSLEERTYVTTFLFFFTLPLSTPLTPKKAELTPKKAEKGRRGNL